MNSSVRAKPIPSHLEGETAETRKEKLSRIRSQVTDGYYSKKDVLRDVADALLMNPEPFENLNDKHAG